jgi:hypothetical protein
MTTTTQRPGRLRKFARRGFLGTLGAGGLTAASAVFGKSTPAYAVCYRNCCALAWCPSVTFEFCSTRSSPYIWNCSASTTLWCRCCEAGYMTSAYTCRYN